MTPQIACCWWLLALNILASAVAKPTTFFNSSSVSLINTSPETDYYSQWSQSGRPNTPTCVNIPRTMSLCHGIGYNQMRLPNLLGHDTISEVVLQAKYWVSLLNLKCHPDTQLFLCSLFSPVCLDRPIYPCRSLCEAVKAGCESRMREYGYPWPDMVKCDKFPLDNDMCISVQSRPTKGDKCKFCNQVVTTENILDNFCRSDFVVKTKLKKVKKTKVTFRKGKVLKLKEGLPRRKMRRPIFLAKNMNVSSCCQNFSKSTDDNFLVMGKKLENGQLVPILVMPWLRKVSKFRQAARMFKRFDCSDPSTVISEKLLETGGVRIIPGGKEQIVEPRPKKPRNRENGRKKKNRRNRMRRRKNKNNKRNLAKTT